MAGLAHNRARPVVCAVMACALAACDGIGGDASGAVSEGEAAELDEIAEELDARRLPPEAIPTVDEAGSISAEPSTDSE